MEEAVTRLKNRLSVERGSYGFFYYAGHGVQSNGENYLLPVDANIPSESYLRDRSVSMQAVLDELNAAGNALNIVVLDACRDNPFSWRRSGSRGLQVVSSQPADSIIVYATSAGSTAADGEGRNGLFTAHLLNNLKKPGLSVRDMFDQTGADVRRASGGAQIPAIYSQFFDVAYLGTIPAVVPPQPSPAPTPQPSPTPSPQPRPTPAVVPPQPAPEAWSLIRTFGHSDNLRSVAWSPDGRRLASGENTVKIWDAESGALLRTLTGHSDDVRSVSYSSDGRRLASESADKTVKIWDVESGSLLRTLVHSYAVWVGAFSPDGRRIASGSDESNVIIWDAENGAQLRTLSGHYHVYSVAWSPDGRRVATTSTKTVRVWDAESGVLLRTITLTAYGNSIPPGHSNYVYSVAWIPDGRWIASGSFDNTVKIWDAESGVLLRTLVHSGSGGVRSVSYSPDGRRLASGGDNVKIWAVEQ
jgi:uncharacterized protein with WD repeat